MSLEGMSHKGRASLVALLFWVLLAGCSRLFPAGVSAPGPSVTLLLPTPTASLLFPDTQVPTLVSTEPPIFQKITIWLPPQFNPSAEGLAGEILREQLQAFDEQHDEFQVEVRVKALDGPGGLLDSLAAASLAAPLALPDLVALPRPLLETAALKGLVYPLDGLTGVLGAPDWYGYARQLAMLQSSTFGLPFAGDALLLVYRPNQIASPPVSWDDPFTQGSELIFPAADPNALFTLLLYQAAGGKIADDQGRPTLDVGVLTEVLTYYQRAAQAGEMPLGLVQYASEDQAWEAFLGQQTSMTVAWTSQYFGQKMLQTETLEAGLIPVPQDHPAYTLATGWVWAVADSRLEHRKLGLQLAEYLLDEAFLARWTEALGLLPTRQGVLRSWQDESARQLAERLGTTAYLYPSADILASLGPVLEQATTNGLQQEKDPATAAQLAVNHLQAP